MVDRRPGHLRLVASRDVAQGEREGPRAARRRALAVVVAGLASWALVIAAWLALQP